MASPQTPPPEPQTAQVGSGAGGPIPRDFGGWWRGIVGEAGLQRVLFYLPLVFLVLFLAVPLGLTLVWSVFERTMFWMEPGFSLVAYENLIFSPRLESLLYSMLYSAVAVVVWPHHVGMITGRTASGQWIVKSGNDGGRVRERPRSVKGAVFRVG